MMRSIGKTLGFDAGFAHLYRPLARRLALVFVVTAVLAMAALLFFDERLVKRMSAAAIQNSTVAVTEKLRRLFDQSRDSLLVAVHQVDGQPLDDTLLPTLSAFLGIYAFLDSINVADAAGNEYVVIRDAEGWTIRRTDAAEPSVANWSRWVDGEVVEQWERRTDVSPTQRPWFTGALATEPGQRHWSDPYEFLTTKDPGISVSSRWRSNEGGEERVIAFNVSLADISDFTLEQSPSENGMMIVFGQQGRALGLPRLARFDEERERRSAVLSPVAELGVPELDAALAAWETGGREPTVFAYSGPGGARWWAGFSRIQLDAAHAVWSVVLVPRADLLGNVVAMRNLSVAGILLAGALLGAVLLVTAMRSIRRQMRSALDRVEQKLGQYHVEERIGEGGNGTVFRARHALLRRPTALKLMNPLFARSEAARKRFEHEVRLTSGLSHPNTVSIYDFGRTSDGTLYYAMELLEGGTLDRVVQISGPLPAGRVIHFLTQASGSLAEAHAKGLIHRDIKPSNLIVCERGGLYDVIKVVDFGLVKELASDDGHLTRADVIVGTPFFMAPETISSPATAGPKSDLYALGAVGYFLLTGRHVFEGESAVEICAAHLHDTPERPSEKSGLPIPADLEEIIMQCLAKDPAERPESAGALQALLAACAAAGTWTQQDARSWWQEHASGLGGPAEGAAPMSQTELLVDLDTRLLSGAAESAR